MNKKIQIYGMFVNMTLVTLSTISSIIILFNPGTPSSYSLIFLLPLMFGILSLCFYEIFDLVPYNLGVTLIISLLFIRNVIAPLLLVKGNFSSSINVDQNSNGVDYSVALLIYEMVCVFFTFLYFKRKSVIPADKSDNEIKLLTSHITEKKFIVVVLIAISILVLCYHVSPQFMLNYRTIFEMISKNSANYEDYMINRKYGTSPAKLFALVVGNYIMRVVILVVPAVVIILFKSREKKESSFQITRLLSLIVCFVPLLFISGAIARSLIYCICLLMLRDKLYYSARATKKTVGLLIIGMIAVLVWWGVRDNSSGIGNSDIWERYSGRVNAYFSGANIVSGVYNLPESFDYRIKYCIGDILSSIPFGNTIFSLDGTTSQEFFNSYNSSMGQIPPTIGMSCYYFGFLLAPIYSVVFSILSFKYSEKFRSQNVRSAIEYTRCLYSIFVFSMGIVMYNIEITLTNSFCILIPMYLMELLSIKEGSTNE